MTFNTQLPSSRLRADLEGLVRLAMTAPPDESDWGYDTYAANIRSILSRLDQDFAALLQLLSRADDPRATTRSR